MGPKRVYPVCEIEDLAEADERRHFILKTISKKIGEIQNQGLGNQKIIELNDEINRLVREKNLLETRILELGGKNYRHIMPKNEIYDFSREMIEQDYKGYRYYGASRHLDGVKELFEKKNLYFVGMCNFSLNQNKNTN